MIVLRGTAALMGCANARGIVARMENVPVKKANPARIASVLSPSPKA